MATGYAPYLLNDIAAVSGMANPKYKVDMHGFLKKLYMGAGSAPIQTSSLAGHKKEVRFWYRPRNTKAQTDTTYACDTVLTPARVEATASVGSTRSISWHLPHATLAQYMEEASQRTTVAGSSPALGISAELMDIIFGGANALLKGMNDDLLGLITWGKNSVVGDNLATNLNLPQSKAAQILTDGMPKILADYHKNGLTGRPQLVGSGLIYPYMLTQPYTSFDQSGFNTALATAQVDFFPDMDFDAAIATNVFGVFEPGAQQIVEYIENRGFQGGTLGVSEFGVLPLPSIDPNGNFFPVMFDYQLRAIDCPTTLTDMYAGGTASYSKGYSLTLYKQFGLFNTSQADAFRHEDVQRSVNGAIRYTATNS